MQVFLKLLLLSSVMLMCACETLFPYDYYVEITNKSEYNIIRVAIISTKNGKIYADNKDDKLIAKNGGSKSFKIIRNDFPDYIVCVEAEDTLEPICTTTLDGNEEITWNGPSSSGWLPATSFPSCPKLFPKCNSEIKE